MRAALIRCWRIPAQTWIAFASCLVFVDGLGQRVQSILLIPHRVNLLPLQVSHSPVDNEKAVLCWQRTAQGWGLRSLMSIGRKPRPGQQSNYARANLPPLNGS